MSRTVRSQHKRYIFSFTKNFKRNFFFKQKVKCEYLELRRSWRHTDDTCRGGPWFVETVGPSCWRHASWWDGAHGLTWWRKWLDIGDIWMVSVPCGSGDDGSRSWPRGRFWCSMDTEACEENQHKSFSSSSLGACLLVLIQFWGSFEQTERQSKLQYFRYTPEFRNSL